eukprot:6073604-Amphidinium_carterae.1
MARASAKDNIMKEILWQSAMADLSAGTYHWYMWVPTEGNLADGPSRRECGSLLEQSSRPVVGLLPLPVRQALCIGAGGSRGEGPSALDACPAP